MAVATSITNGSYALGKPRQRFRHGIEPHLARMLPTVRLPAPNRPTPKRAKGGILGLKERDHEGKKAPAATARWLSSTLSLPSPRGQGDHAGDQNDQALTKTMTLMRTSSAR
jgi:hypothetical protein